jgi:hypothetical protein
MNFFRAVTGIGNQQSKFKEKCTPQERWQKHLSIVRGRPNLLSVVVEKSKSSKLIFKKPYLLYITSYADME